MVLVGASAADTERLLQAVGRPDLVLACVNTARQCVVSGPNPAIEALFEAVMADGEPRLHRLALPYASHHPALAPVAMGFLEELRALPQRPLRVAIHSSVGRRVYTDADDLQQAMADCVVKPADLPHALLSVPLTERTLFVDMGIGDNLARCVGSTLTGGRALAPLMKSPAELAALFAGLVPSGDHDEPASEPPAGALVEHLKSAVFRCSTNAPAGGSDAGSSWSPDGTRPAKSAANSAGLFIKGASARPPVKVLPTHRARLSPIPMSTNRVRSVSGTLSRAWGRSAGLTTQSAMAC